MPYALGDWQFERRYEMEIGLGRRQDPESSSSESTPLETETVISSSAAETSSALPTSSAAPSTTTRTSTTASTPTPTPTPTPTSTPTSIPASPSQSATLPTVSETPSPSATPTDPAGSSSVASQSSASQTSTRSVVGSLSSAGSSPVGTQLVTSFITTNGAGQSVVIVTVTSNYAVSTSAPSKSSSNTGAIVGGVVGGVGGLLVIAIILWFLIRRRRKDKFEENMFEPDRNVDRPVDLVEGDDVNDPEAIARPYQLPASPTRPEMGMAANSRPLSMDSGPNQYSRPLSSEHHEAISMPRPTSGNSYYAPPSAGMSMPMPMPLSLDHMAHLQSRANSTYGQSQPTTSEGMSNGGSSSARALKDHEARRMHVANQDGGVVVHSDGGRVNEVPDDDQPNEIPPTYDSIGGPSGAR